MRRAARLIVTVAAGLWWAPLIVLTIGRIVCGLAWWRLRLGWVQLLRVAGHLDAAMRALERLEADTPGRHRHDDKPP